MQAEGQDERGVQAAQQEAAKGVERECALLHTRLRLLATHALVSNSPPPPPPPPTPPPSPHPATQLPAPPVLLPTLNSVLQNHRRALLIAAALPSDLL